MYSWNTGEGYSNTGIAGIIIILILCVLAVIAVISGPFPPQF